MIRNRRRAFSLVELLVVIGIIVVLVGLLVPTLARARGFANRARCQNNLRQILIATQQYILNDATNRLPFPNWNNNANLNSIYDPGPAQPGWLYNWPNKGIKTDDMRTGALWKYIQSEDAYHCPLHQPPYINGLTENITSFIMNGAVCGYGANSITAPVWGWAAFKNPSEQVLYFECDSSGAAIQGGNASLGGFWNDGSSKPDEVRLSTRHGRGCSMGYFDFHVDSYDLNQFQADLNLGPGPLWCNPGKPNGH